MHSVRIVHPELNNYDQYKQSFDTAIEVLSYWTYPTRKVT